MHSKNRAAYQQALLDKQLELADDIARLEQESRRGEQPEVEDYGDKAENTYTKEALFQQIESDRGLLKDVEDALGRIARSEFGKCEECGRDIEPKRLEAVPWARHCIACERRPPVDLV